MLAADVAGAEELLLAALELAPGSHNISQQLGKLYYDSGDEARAVEYLDRLGMVARAVELPERPVLDGHLDEAAWTGVQPLSEFYQCIHRMSALPTAGRSEAYVGYRGDTLFVAVKGYEPSTEGLVAQVTTRDGLVHMDDCLEVFLDTNHDFQSYYQVVFNTLGTVADFHTEDENEGDWNGTYEVGTFVADTYWVAEVAIPVAQLNVDHINPGAIWGFNIARVRIGNASEYGQWVPTFGAARRPDRFGFLVFD